MGGKAFAQAVADGQPSINVRRLSATEHHDIGRQVSRGLHALLPDAELVIPPSFECKDDFGDVDILLSTSHIVHWNHVATALGAKAWIDQGSIKAPMCSLAMRIGGSSADEPPAQQYFVKDHSTDRKDMNITSEAYAQVDVSVVPINELPWRSFCSSYSDMGLILGRISKRFGFRVDTRGLSVEMKELHSFKDAKISVADREGTIFLSGDPSVVLPWLRLDMSEGYARGFVNAEELFEWLEPCRFLNDEIPLVSNDDTRDEARLSSRPVFAAFMARQAAGETPRPDSESARARLREQLLLDAVTFFGKSDELAARKAALSRKFSNGVATEQLKQLLLEITHSSDRIVLATLRGFRRFVSLRDGQPVILQQALQDDQSQLYLFLDGERRSLQPGFRQWVRDHHEELKTLGKKPAPQP